ncbi:MAG: flippase-like protein [Actinotalea sp.]|nr:flippase-like protein [Actinotalea sp.]
MSSPSPVRLGGPGAHPAELVVDEHVRIVDTPAERVHHPADLVGVVLSALGIGLVLVLAMYAQGTTTGLTDDVQGVGDVVRRLRAFPVAVLEGVINFVAPIAVLTELVLRRQVRHALEAIAAGVVGILLALLATWLVTTFGADELRGSFTVFDRGEPMVVIPALLTGTASLLTAAGSRNRRRTVAWSWNLLWVALGVALITGLVTLPGALMTVLLGRLTGLSARFLSGVQSERAYGDALVDGIRRAGFDPLRLVRVRDVGVPHPDPDDPLAVDLAAVAITRYGDNRVYAMTTEDGDRLDVVVLDGDRQVVGMLTRFWRSLRLRGIDGRAVVSLRQAAERAALLAYAAWSAGVSTPRLLAMAEAADSMLLVQQHAHGAVPLRDLPPEALSDDVLDAIWEQLRIAHAAGLAHRALSADVVLLERADVEPEPGASAAHGIDGGGAVPLDVEPGATAADSPLAQVHRRRAGDAPPVGASPVSPVALITGWEQGDVASSDLARRVDISQMLAVLALRVGAERAVASAGRALPDEQLAQIGPLLQAIALPRATREEARQRKGVLGEVREALLALLPEADLEPESLVRFGARTVLTTAATLIVVIVVITTISFDQIVDAFRGAEPWWAAVGFALGLVTFLGSALSLVAFSPIRLPLWRATLVQAAGSFIALAAPAGIGPAALNLRMLTRRGVSKTLAVASVGLVQVSQFITTVALLLVLSLASGRALELPSRTVLGTVAVIAVVVVAAMLVPVVRVWVWSRLVPLWRQTWPRLVQMFSHPGRLAVAVGGNLLMTLGYLGAFYACLAAFGLTLSPIDLALIYLLGNTAGAVVPVPGGVGAVEGALIAGLTAAGGLSLPEATSVAFLFRALTFWARVPFGWVAMRVLQRTGEL